MGFLTCSMLACLRIDVIFRLFQSPEVWYFVICCVLFVAGSIVLNGTSEFQAWSLLVYQTGFILTAVLLPLADAAPTAIRNLVRRYFSIGLCAVSSISYLRNKVDTAHIHSEMDVPEVGVQGIATFSLHNVSLKSQLLVCSFSALMAYRGWRHPEVAAVLLSTPLLDELHSRGALVGGRSRPQLRFALQRAAARATVVAAIAPARGVARNAGAPGPAGCLAAEP